MKSRETLRRMGEGGVRIVRWWCERGRITGCGDGSHFSVHERAPDRSCLALPNNQKIKNEAPPGLMRDRSCAASVVFSSLRGPLCAGEA